MTSLHHRVTVDPATGRPFSASCFQTFSIAQPLATHWRTASCDEVDCQQYRHGWRLRIEGLSPQDLHLARTCGRRYHEEHVAEGETWLVYEPGQPCFRAATHRAPVGRPPLFLTRAGDHRPVPGTQQVVTADQWVDEFATNQDAWAAARQRG